MSASKTVTPAPIPNRLLRARPRLPRRQTPRRRTETPDDATQDSLPRGPAATRAAKVTAKAESKPKGFVSHEDSKDLTVTRRCRAWTVALAADAIDEVHREDHPSFEDWGQSLLHGSELLLTR